MKTYFLIPIMMLILSVPSFAQHVKIEDRFKEIPRGEMHLYSGGQFLGCFNCQKYDSDSICYKYSKYGNEHSAKSIFNKYSPYGNKHSSKSPWNIYSTSDDVPQLVMNNKNLGYFTINTYRSKRFDQAKKMRNMYDRVEGDLVKLRALMCE